MLKDDEICPTKLEMQNKDNSDDCISRSSNIFGYRTLRSMEPQYSPVLYTTTRKGKARTRELGNRERGSISNEKRRPNYGVDMARIDVWI